MGSAERHAAYAKAERRLRSRGGRSSIEDRSRFEDPTSWRAPWIPRGFAWGELHQWRSTDQVAAAVLAGLDVSLFEMEHLTAQAFPADGAAVPVRGDVLPVPDELRPFLRARLATLRREGRLGDPILTPRGGRLYRGEIRTMVSAVFGPPIVRRDVPLRVDPCGAGCFGTASHRLPRPTGRGRRAPRPPGALGTQPHLPHLPQRLAGRRAGTSGAPGRDIASILSLHATRLIAAEVAGNNEQRSGSALMDAQPDASKRHGQFSLRQLSRPPVEWIQVSVERGEQADPVPFHPLRCLIAALVPSVTLFGPEAGHPDIQTVLVAKSRRMT